MSKDEVISFEEELETHGAFCWTNRGVSMLPLLRENRDLMVIEKKGGEPLKKYDAVLFRRPGVTGRGAYVLHRILRINPDGTYWIVGDNCACGENVPEENILGILTEVVRDGRTIRVTDQDYRAYVHLWCDWYPVRFLLIRCRELIKAVYRKIRKIG